MRTCQFRHIPYTNLNATSGWDFDHFAILTLPYLKKVIALQVTRYSPSLLLRHMKGTVCWLHLSNFIKSTPNSPRSLFQPLSISGKTTFWQTGSSRWGWGDSYPAPASQYVYFLYINDYTTHQKHKVHQEQWWVCSHGVEHLARWRGQNNLQLNALETVEVRGLEEPPLSFVHFHLNQQYCCLLWKPSDFWDPQSSSIWSRQPT